MTRRWHLQADRQRAVAAALDDPDFAPLWTARELLAYDGGMVRALVLALRDPTFVGLRDAADVRVAGRAMPLYGHGISVKDDLFRCAPISTCLGTLGG